LASQCGADLARFLDQLTMGAEADTWDPRADRISMLTLHASKGLEFPVVFIVGCDDGLLPLRPWAGAEIDYAEERRLLFVGMTRATTRLILTGAQRRMVRGELTQCAPSPFLASVDRALLDAAGEGSPAFQRNRKRKPAAQQLTLLLVASGQPVITYPVAPGSRCRAARRALRRPCGTARQASPVPRRRGGPPS
jgi:ATP-dependent exoDNAse (exonuclease V) beta subunit